MPVLAHWSVSGIRLTRFPVAWNSALATAGAMPTMGVSPAPAEGNEKLKPYVRAVHDLAKEFAAECVVPLHTAFNDARAARWLEEKGVKTISSDLLDRRAVEKLPENGQCAVVAFGKRDSESLGKIAAHCLQFEPQSR